MKTVIAPPDYQTYQIELPLTSLHVMEAGYGDPLIVVPATISELENWVDLIQFMAQWFHVYFFELPGHGGSTPFGQKFSTGLVAETVSQLLDHLQVGRFNLMGFSFGGILAIRTFERLHNRIDRLILNAPCLTKRAILLSHPRLFAIKHINRLFRKRAIQVQFYLALQHPQRRARLMGLFQDLGKLERREQLEDKLGRVGISTLEVLAEEIEEALNFELMPPVNKYDTPCYLTMSVHDPLLDFHTTLKELENSFSNVHVTRLYLPFHQPPEPFTFEELNRDFGESAKKFIG